MDSLIPLIVILILAFPVIAIVAVVMAVTTRERLRATERRLVMLERRIEAGATAPPRAAAPTPAPAPQAMPAPDTILSGPRPAAAAAEPPPAAPTTPESVTPTHVTPASVTPVPAAPKPAVPPTPARPPVGPARPAMSFEERFGTQWVVWIGGLALALGGFFLVRYSIEQGLIGPGVRVALGALLALALVAAGEWTRRNE